MDKVMKSREIEAINTWDMKKKEKKRAEKVGARNIHENVNLNNELHLKGVNRCYRTI